MTIGWVDGSTSGHRRMDPDFNCVSNTVRAFVLLGSVHGFAVLLLIDLSGLMASGVGLVARQCAL